VTPALSLIDPTSRSASTAEFAEAMSALAGGVVLVTCRIGTRPWGMTVTAFSSVSADPPIVLASLGSRTASVRAIEATGGFGVSILGEKQLDVARFGSNPGAAKFLEPFVDPGAVDSASPAVAGALAHLDCELLDTVGVADHTIVFGRVRAARAAHRGTPLLYHRRAYRTLGPRAGGRLNDRKDVRWLSS
jgi:flavin reductase (DIM6/NTAB) family NADH-FMN oxidoreductase RutF